MGLERHGSTFHAWAPAWAGRCACFVCIASLVLGVVLGQDSPALGVVVTLLGILLFFVINAVFMVFLDLAADVRFIRMHINKKNV